MTVHRMVVGTMAAGLAVAGLAGCGSSSPSNPPSPGPSSGMTVTPLNTPSSSPSMSASPSATGGSGIGLCTNNIRVIKGEGQGAAGHVVLVLIFNNVGHTTCRMYGYPGLDLVTSSGHVVAHARRTLSGMAGGATSVASVTLAPGASASALVEASDVPQGGITDCGNYSLMVTPPEEYVSVPVATAMMPQCELEIHPVVAGTHGGMR